MRIGPKELEKLRALGSHFAQVVPCRQTQSLVRKGLLEASEDGCFARITPAGLRALADAADAGKVVLFDMDKLRKGDR